MKVQGMRCLALGVITIVTLSGSSCSNSAGYTPQPTPVLAEAQPSAAASGWCTVTNGVLGEVQTGSTCSQSGASASPAPGASGAASATSTSCPGLMVVSGATSTVQAKITFYGAPDNTPSGYKQLGLSGDALGGIGTYCDPTDFAAGTSEDATVPSDTRIYVPSIQKYFARNDGCAGCSGLWFDLYVGGNQASDNPQDVINCEDSLTVGGEQQVILNPPPGEPVPSPGPIYNGSCPHF
jgi:hypothetical protein